MAEVAGSVRELQALVQRTAQPAIAAECRRKWSELGLAHAPKALWFPRKIYPYAAMLDHVFNVVEDGEIDVILFADQRKHSPKHNIRDVMGYLQAPIIDLSGEAGEFADVHFDINKPDTWNDAAKRILEFRERRKKLAEPYKASVEPDLQLMAHAFVCGRPLAAKRYPQVRDAVCYPGYWSAEMTVPAAEKLVRRGHMKKTFFDRMHECRACSSRRLSVREECPSCRSPNMSEVELIHHYHCATLLPETEFRRGSALVCPKCSQQLRNYGKDYDKPGRTMLCGSCSKTTSEPEVGFVCMDCSAEFNGDEARQVDVFSYELTDLGVKQLTRPRSLFGSPDLSEWKAALTDDTQPIAIAEITYAARQSIVKEHGEGKFERLRKLFLENMTNFLAESGEYRAGATNDYFLLFGYDDEFARRLKLLAAKSSETLAVQIEPKLRVAARQRREKP